jgi:hypothetical protein
VSNLGDHVGREAAPRESPLPAPEPVAGSAEFTSDTSLTDLFQAILGVEARRAHDKSELGQIVDAQMRALRKELGLPEPVPARPAPKPPDASGGDDIRETLTDDADEVVHPSGGRRPAWRALVTGLADRARNSVGLMILVSIASANA